MAKNKYTITDLHKYAKIKGGKCLSVKYFRNDTKYLWKCSVSSHKQFEMPWGNVIRKKPQWCRECYNDFLRLDFSIIENKVKKFGGKLITKKEEYKTSKSLLIYFCDKGHKVETDWGRLGTAKIGENGKIEGRWCRECNGKKKWTIPKLQKIAKENGGELISKEYLNSKSKLEWKCNNNHNFEADIHHVISSNQWCSICSSGVSERITRLFFEHIFNCKFPSIYPDWLRNQGDKKSKLELDGYNEKLKTAFEYQGIQHYEYLKHFHRKGVEDFEKQKKHDEIKRIECKKRKIELLEIPYTKKRDEIFDYIIFLCKERKIKVKNKRKIDWKKFNLYPDKLQEWKEYAKKKGGECLSNTYIDSGSKLEWKCSCGHKWERESKFITSNWCMKCGGKKRKDIKDVQKYIEEKGGKLLSKYSDYKNNNSRLKVLCAKGHTWKPTWQSLNGHWCSVCSGNKKGTIEEFQKISQERGGECLSKIYSSKKLKFQCNQGHIWKATPGNVKNKNSWCRQCHNLKKREENYHSNLK